MKSWVVTTLTAVTCLLMGAAEVHAQYYDEAPSAGATGAGSSPAEGKHEEHGEKPAKSRSKSRARRRSSARASSEEPEDTGRRVWTETATARVKTVYDEQGNVQYQKAWDKKTGREVPVPEAGLGAEEDTSRAVNVHDAPEAKPYGRLRRDEDGEYEERRMDPRPQAKNHHLHRYPEEPRKHPYEFSLDIYPWFNFLSGSIKGTGAGKGSLADDERTSYEFGFNNQRVGYSYTHIQHNSGVTGTFTFNGVAYAAVPTTTIYTETLSIIDGFYRFNCYDSRDCWMDFLIGGKLGFINAAVTSPATTTSIKSTVPLPEIGLIGSYSLLDNIKLRGFLKGAFGAASGSSATIIDSEAEFVYTIPGDQEYSVLNQLSLGYKYLLVDFTKGKDSASQSSGTISHDGPFLKYQAMF
jgi:hypothetical protein